MEEPQRQPLIAKPSLIRSYTFDPENLEAGLVEAAAGEDTPNEEAGAVHGVTDVMMYRTAGLTTWEAFSMSSTGSKNLIIWLAPDLWRMILGRLAPVALIVAIAVFIVVPRPDRMEVAKFTDVSKFLNVVTGLLMSFFLSSSMNRWYSCVNGFLELLDSIRNLQMQFVALGVPEEWNILTLRWAYVSAWLLYCQLMMETKRLADDSFDLKEERDKMWTKLCERLAYIDKTGKTALLKEEEADVLRLTRDPPGMMWMWVAALIGRIAQDGWVPPMPSPTYGRIMTLCQTAHGGIRQVRAAISVQAPLAYTHMLATLVHINNLINAVTLGIVSGLAVGTWTMRHSNLYSVDNEASRQEVAQDWQNMAVTFLYCFFGPLLWQALLLIAMHLAQPFDSEEAKIPLDRLMVQLEIDMCNGRDLIEHMDEAEIPFSKPFFKPSPSKHTTSSSSQ